MSHAIGQPKRSTCCKVLRKVAIYRRQSRETDRWLKYFAVHTLNED